MLNLILMFHNKNNYIGDFYILLCVLKTDIKMSCECTRKVALKS